MRHGSGSRRNNNSNNSNNSNNRGRHNNNRGRHNNNRPNSFDSNGPEVRIRGSAFQINEKYVTLARDATAAGDTVLAESYLQHAEHYQRIINEQVKDRPPVNKPPVSKENTDEKTENKADSEGKEEQKQTPEQKTERPVKQRTPRRVHKPVAKDDKVENEDVATSIPFLAEKVDIAALDDEKPAPKKRAPRARKVKEPVTEKETVESVDA